MKSQNKSHVVFLKSRLSFQGGLEKATLRLASAFARAGSEVSILTTSTPKKDLPFIPHVTVIALHPTSKFTLFHLIRFNHACKKWLKKNQADIVFGMERTTDQTHLRAGSGVHATYLERRKLIDSFFKRISFLLNPLHAYLRWNEKKAFENPHLITLFTNSKMVKKELLSRYKIEKDKIEVVHNGVEWKEWDLPFRESLEQKRKETFEFLFIGNGYRRKGLLFLLKGLSLLPTKNFHLNVVGRDREIFFFKKLTRLLGLEKNVTFCGPQASILSFYQKADCLVLPTLYDPFANVTVEALAMGLFVVTSSYNGAYEVLTETSGVIIKNLLDPRSVKEALMVALEHPKTPSSSIQIRNRIKELDFSTQLDKIVSKTLKMNE